MINQKKREMKMFLFSTFLFFYIFFYAMFRHDYVFVHTCSYMNEEKVSDEVKVGLNAPDVFYPDWFVVYVLSSYIVYQPLIFLETSLHHYNLLPSSCPWK